MRELIPFVQFKKREKPPWKNVTFSKVASRKASHLFADKIMQCVINRVLVLTVMFPIELMVNLTGMVIHTRKYA